MKRPARILLATLLFVPVILLGWLTVTESGLHWAYQQLKSNLPGELHITRLEGRLLGTITCKELHYQQDELLIKLGETSVHWRPVALITANLDISGLYIQSLNITLPSRQNSEPFTALPEFGMPLRMAIKDLVIKDISVRYNEKTYTFDKAQLDANNLFGHINIEKFALQADAFQLHVNGRVRPNKRFWNQLELEWQTRLDSTTVVSGKGTLSGDTESIRLQQHLGGALQATLDAEIKAPLAELNWHATLDSSNFDPSRLHSDWPAMDGRLKLTGTGSLDSATLSGSISSIHNDFSPVNASLKIRQADSNTMHIEYLNLHSPDSDTHLEASGHWMPGLSGGSAMLDLNWKNLQWPLHDSPWFSSASGSGSLEGNFNQYTINLSYDSPWRDAIPSTWHTIAVGTLEGLHVQSLRISALNGEISAKGHIDWSSALRWETEASLANIDPSSLWSEWPGKLQGRFSHNGRFENGSLYTATDISKITGTLRGYLISLHSRFSSHDRNLDIALVDLISASAHINAKGKIADTLNLDWKIIAPDLAELYPHARGQLNASGKLKGTRGDPTIQTSFNGHGLQLPGYQIGAIDGSFKLDLYQRQQFEINLAANKLNLKGYPLQSVKISGNQHLIRATASSREVLTQIELRGEADADGWKGRIEKADINAERAQQWRLKEPSAVHISKDTLLINTLCWQGQNSNICISLEKQKDLWQASVNLQRIPLMLFSPWLPAELMLDGAANGTAELRYDSMHASGSGSADILLPPGTVSHPLLEGEREKWAYQGGSVSASLDQRGLNIRSDLVINHDEHIHCKVELPGAQILPLIPSQQAIVADARLSVHKLAFLETVIPEIQDLQGEITLDIKVAGTLAQPEINGRAQLVNGSLRIPRLGLAIDRFTLSSWSDNFEKLGFRLDASSGNGSLSLTGNTLLDAQAGWPTEISIKGDQFEASHIPEALVQISPDLQIRLKDRTIDIKGNLHIPYAQLQPKDITTAAHTSDDAVLIGLDQPPQEKWSILTHIQLTLGERVHFYGFGFEGRFGGKLLLSDKPGQLTSASGEITIPEGHYRAYGQRLEVVNGRLLYTDGPLMNPGLDLQAVRRINDVTAGLKVRGSLNQPQIELFSVPAMGQTDILSYLLLGRPMEMASDEEGAMMAQAALALGLSGGDRIARVLGERFRLDEMRIESSDDGDQASLIMGRYLSPRIYVSYGVGLIEVINTFTVRYRISDKWQLKAESGEYQGADILYTFER